jgi:hypothetical protein
MQQLQFGIFVAAMIALVVCGCILTRKPKKVTNRNLTAGGAGRTSARLFALEEERGGNWRLMAGAIKEARPTL